MGSTVQSMTNDKLAILDTLVNRSITRARHDADVLLSCSVVVVVRASSDVDAFNNGSTDRGLLLLLILYAIKGETLRVTRPRHSGLERFLAIIIYDDGAVVVVQ
jgi:hypothetical protein